MGSLTNMARFNDFHNNCFRDAWMILIGDTFFSLLSGWTIFAFLGFISTKAGFDPDTDLDNLAIGGPRLILIVFFAGIVEVAESKGGKMVMKFLYSLLLLTLGLDSVLGCMDNILGTFTDHFKVLRKKRGKLEF